MTRRLGETSVSTATLDRLVTKRAAKHLREFGREVTAQFGDRVTSIKLFGSRARGDARRDSDYDVVVFIDSTDSRRSIDHVLSDLAYPHIVAGIDIQPFSVPLNFLERPDSPSLAVRVRREGVELL
ncbi:nucleotidyltransferase family protein [Rhizobium laguerreae]|uniref:nucleotidyltransferase family protein n=1 Tax=Rhizobium laguerreae TaxID=1076926 RepID=UPI00103ACAEF|nr:nucleotidyltransferase domain-containing protein [Rhizobium laguerreae]TBX98434.1 nucleotidyltransferase domain-containing protein [Rhizobium laguerreae]